MSIATVKNQLASMQAAISGIKHAFAQAPATISPADAPLFINLTGAGSADYAQQGDFSRVMTRFYTMRLYVLPATQGIPGEGERQVEPLIAATYAYFNARPSLGNLVARSFIIRDTGVTRMMFEEGGIPWIGCDFTLSVEEYESIMFAPGE
jgi:hypothetical protein